ncbi:MAG: glutathione S-transferase [Marinicellaceae bacterium]
MIASNNILYSFRRCPYAIRTRMALSYSNIHYEHREILLKDKPQSMLDFSSKGTVPVLVIKDFVIDESLDVMLWALKKQDSEDWMLKQTRISEDEILDWINKCDLQFKPILDQYKYSDRHPLSENQYREQSLWFLESLESQLKSHKFLLSEKISLADVAIFPFIRQYAFVNKSWFDTNEYVHLQNWLNHWLNSPLFQSVMKKLPLWIEK